jgi:hypothetical protein
MVMGFLLWNERRVPSLEQEAGAGGTAKKTTKTPFSLHAACVKKRK